MRAYTLLTAKPAERRHEMFLYLYYLAATVLPGGVMLLLLRWIWLRMHM